jgi:hypothetical protein
VFFLKAALEQVEVSGQLVVVWKFYQIDRT